MSVEYFLIITAIFGILYLLALPKYRQITKAVTIDWRGKIIFTPEEIADAKRRVAEMEQQEKEILEFREKTEFSRVLIQTKCGNMVEYYHYTERIPAAVYFNVKKKHPNKII